MTWTLSDSEPKARVRHICDCCRKPIEPGVVYRRATLADSSDFWEWKAHLECDEIYQAYSRSIGEWEGVNSWADVLEWHDGLVTS